MGSVGTSDLAAEFKDRAAYMKTWKPESAPSNRDRLELYALHKQAVSGDAKPTLPDQDKLSAADRAKHQAWKSKSGLHRDQAMREYILESERQVRVYGNAANSVTGSTGGGSGSVNGHNSLYGGSQPNGIPMTSAASQPRGLAAIPLLCAAGSENRTAYLRRLASTPAHQAWWIRQEALCANGGIFTWPETLLIKVATIIEFVSLHCEEYLPFPAPVVQSFLWPLHNVMLSYWMLLILVLTSWGTVFQLWKTLLLGARRTGYTLPGIWADEIEWTAQSCYVLVERHQPLSARLMGLIMLPYTGLVGITRCAYSPGIVSSMLYIGAMLMTWWYWLLILPWYSVVMLFWAIVAGSCCAMIEITGI
jgi:acyl-CoA-binding protein